LKSAHLKTNPSTTSLQKNCGLIESWRWWIGPALLSLLLAFVYLDPFAGDWDALDYTVQALKGEPSSMILGRMLFIFSNRAAFSIAHELFGLAPERAYLLFKYMVVAESPLAVIAWWLLALDLTGSRRSATAAALMLCLSPFYIIYSGQAMTEIPSLLLLAIALTVHYRGLKARRTWMVLLGAILMGACVNLREGAALYAPWLVLAPLICGWRIDKRTLAVTFAACVLFMLSAFGPFAFWYWLNIADYRSAWQHWAAYTRVESARHPVTLTNFKALLRYFLIAGPLALVAFPVAAFREYRERGLTPLLVLGLIGLLANLSLIVHYSVVLNGRYLLTGLPAMLPLVADYFVREQTAKVKNDRRAFVNVVLGILFIGAVLMNDAWPVSWSYIRDRSTAKDYIQQLSQIPKDGVIISGSQTVAVNYWKGIGSGNWEAIGTGVAWPGPKLKESIDWYLNHGRRVFVDTDPRWWSPCGWQALEIGELNAVRDSFRFRLVAGKVYEILPRSDFQANDDPGFDRLLPENRPNESKLCPR
jgi:hypothetical protein